MTFERACKALKLGFQSSQTEDFIGLQLDILSNSILNIEAGSFQDYNLTGFGIYYLFEKPAAT
jgi:hypothetical protein